MFNFNDELSDEISVALSTNEGDFIIWDNCNRMIPIALDNLSDLIFKLCQLEEYFELRDTIKVVDPLTLVVTTSVEALSEEDDDQTETASA